MALNFEKRSVAFCFLDQDYQINRFGGSLETYGLRDLQEGQHAENVFPFLEVFILLFEEAQLKEKMNRSSKIFLSPLNKRS